MKIAHRLLAVACLSIAGLSGCAGNSVPTEPTTTEATPQTSVIHYSAKDIAALPLGEFLHFDLTQPNTVYALTYADPADLDHVLVIRSNDKYVLGDRSSTTAQGPSDAQKEIVLSADEPAVENLQEVVCNCPCCQLVDGGRVCC
jgi:hypothetical protein